jgi:hypothetical protein
VGTATRPLRAGVTATASSVDWGEDKTSPCFLARSKAMRVEWYRKTRYWAVVEADSTLVCLCVYRKGAEEVVKRLQALDDTQQWQDMNAPTEEGESKVVSCDLF